MAAPLRRRNCSEVRPSPCTAASAYGESASSVLRTIQPELAVRVDALAEELDPRLQDEVARHLLPGEMELVALGPHVRARGGERVLLGDRVVGGGAREARGPDVAVPFELTRPLVVRSRTAAAEGRRRSAKRSGAMELHVGLEVPRGLQCRGRCLQRRRRGRVTSRRRMAREGEARRDLSCPRFARAATQDWCGARVMDEARNRSRRDGATTIVAAICGGRLARVRVLRQGADDAGAQPEPGHGRAHDHGRSRPAEDPVGLPDLGHLLLRLARLDGHGHGDGGGRRPRGQRRLHRARRRCSGSS